MWVFRPRTPKGPGGNPKRPDLNWHYPEKVGNVLFMIPQKLT